MTQSKQKNISFVFAIAAILSVIGSAVQPAKYTDAKFLMFSVLCGTAFPLLLTSAGYFIQSTKPKNNKNSLKVLISPALIAGAISVGISIFVFFFIQVSGKNTDILSILKQVLFLPLKGFPQELWLIPTLIISLTLIFLLKKRLSITAITVITAALYVIFTIFLNFYPVFPEVIAQAGKFVTYIFSNKHSGIFSGMLFIVLGMQLADKKNFRKRSVYLTGAILSALLIATEALIILKIGANKNSFFHISSAIFAYNLTAFVCNCPEITFIEQKLLNDFGRSFFLIGQLIAGTKIFLAEYPNSLFAKFFTSEKISIEFILFFGICISLFYCANKSSNEDVAGVFFTLVQKFVLTILYLPSVISSKINHKIKNAVCTVAFATLPVLLWFIERQIKYSLCCDLFTACLLLIIFCSLDRRLTPTRVSAVFFSGFFIVAAAMYISATISSATVFADIGRMMLFFFLPLGIEIAQNKEKIGQLLENYTYGLYLSFGIFFFYCACFRPYDITRYKGAFCNANMCGLYLVSICLVALCNLPKITSIKDIIKKPLHWLVFATSFAFIAFTISRTAAVGIAAALAVKFFAEFSAESNLRKLNLASIKKAASYIGLLIIVMSVGLIISYTAIRCIPALIDSPIFLMVEFTDTFEYKVKPGESFFSENYISPIRFFEAWFNRSFAAVENLNELSTGRIDIYQQYLKSISLVGHSALRIPIFTTGEYMYAHNAFLQIAFNCGLPVGLGFLALCITAVVRAIRKTTKDKKYIIFGAVCIVSYLSCGMFESMECFYYPLLFSALTGFMLLAITPSEKDTDIEYTVSNNENKISVSVNTTTKIDPLTVKKVIFCTVSVIIFAAFIYFLFEARNSQEGMSLFYQFMQN